MRFGKLRAGGSFATMAVTRDPIPRHLNGTEAASLLFAPLARERVETLAFVYLGRGQSVLGMRHNRSEYADTLDLPIRDVVADALAFRANAVVMAHNHPSGDSTPSSADREATSMLARALEPLGVRLIDHLVITTNGFTSFRALGLL